MPQAMQAHCATSCLHEVRHRLRDAFRLRLLPTSRVTMRVLPSGRMPSRNSSCACLARQAFSSDPGLGARFFLMAAIAWRAVDKTAVEERPTAVTLSPAMAKIIATAHIVLSISATILVGVRYAEAMEFRICANHNDAATCGRNCKIIGSVEFHVQPPRTVAVKVMPRKSILRRQPTIYSLENCVIIDERNWSCSVRQEGVMGRHEMVDGRYRTENLIDGKWWPSHCAR